jgi:hypothetical protein
MNVKQVLRPTPQRCRARPLARWSSAHILASLHSANR